MKKLFAVMAVLALLSLGGIAQAITPRYTVTALGPPGRQALAYGLNDLGQVVGHSVSGGAYDSGLTGFFQDGAAVTTLGGMPYPWAVNNSGRVVGNYAWPPGGGVVWDQSTGLYKDIEGMYAARAVNEVGWVVGSNRSDRAILWDGNTVIDLGVIPGYSYSSAYGINDNGQVVGACSGGSPNRAFIWGDGIMSPLMGFESAISINNNGEVAGQTAEQQAAIWCDGVITPLGTLGGSSSRAFGINDRRQVVGTSDSSYSAQWRVLAFLWEDGVMYDLNNLIPQDSGWRFEEARAINERGQIVGVGYYNNQSQAFILNPEAVPEPSSILTLLCGIGTLGTMMRRIRH